MGKMKAIITEGSTEPALIVFGSDEAGKAHASWFGQAETELAIRAAGLMAMKVLPVSTPEHRAIATELPAGRIFESGRGFVPFCKGTVLERLAAFPEAYQPPAPIIEAGSSPETAPAITGVPSCWEDIAAGSLVLAPEEAPEVGWYEAVVIEAKPDALYVLRWRDWPDLPAFVRRGVHIGLMSSSAEPQ